MELGVRRRRGLCSAKSAATGNHGRGCAAERLGAPREHCDIHGDGEKHTGYQRDLERGRCYRRNYDDRNHQCGRSVHGARGLAIADHRSGYGDKSRRPDKISHG